MDEELGWLGRWLDLLPEDPAALGATALGGGDLLQGDLRPQTDPRTMLTAGLDWLGGDVDRLGRRYDELHLLA